MKFLMLGRSPLPLSPLKLNEPPELKEADRLPKLSTRPNGFDEEKFDASKLIENAAELRLACWFGTKAMKCWPSTSMSILAPISPRPDGTVSKKAVPVNGSPAAKVKTCPPGVWRGPVMPLTVCCPLKPVMAPLKVKFRIVALAELATPITITMISGAMRLPGRSIFALWKQRVATQTSGCKDVKLQSRNSP